MNHLTSRSICIWPRAEVFSYGVFPVQPHPRFTVNNIKRLVFYARNKAKSGYPRLNYTVWKHVACNKLHITEDVAWIYFQACAIMSAPDSLALKEMELYLSKVNTVNDFDQAKSQQTIDLFTFVLFVYLQMINKLSLRSSVASISAEWPGSPAKNSDSLSERSAIIRPYRNNSEQYQLQFITENMLELLELFAEQETFSSGRQELTLSADALDALSFLFEGTVDKLNSIKPIRDIIFDPKVLQNTGYNKTTRSFSLRGLHSWLRSCIVQNPFSVEACILSGTRIQWNLGSVVNSSSGVGNETGLDNAQFSSTSSRVQPTKRQKIATNKNMVPKTTGLRGNKLLMLSLISNQVIARASRLLKNATVKLHRINSSYIYLLSPLRCATIDRCCKSTIVLGPIESTLLITGCEDCLIIAPARRVMLSCCRRCTLHLSTPTRPILLQPSLGYPSAASTPTATSVSSSSLVPLSPSPVASCPGGNEDIVFAPYNTAYADLTKHLNKAALDPSLNLWDQPFVLGHDFGRSEISQSISLSTSIPCFWDVLQPQNFVPFNIPIVVANDDQIDTGLQQVEESNDLIKFLIASPSAYKRSGGYQEDDDTKPHFSLPIPLPNLYSDALAKRARFYSQWQKLIKESNLSEEEYNVFSSMVEQRFRSWLTETGSTRELQLLSAASSELNQETPMDTRAVSSPSSSIQNLTPTIS